VPGPIQDALRETTLLTVTQDYTKFEFFSVRSSEEIQRFVDGEASLGDREAFSKTPNFQ
jgi:hypothetical protein